MPILLVFLLVAACLPVEWPAPPAGFGAGGSAALTAAAVAGPLLAAFTLRTWVLRALGRDPGGRGRIAATYGRVRRGLVFANLGAAVAAVVALGWGWAVQNTLTVAWHGDDVLAPFAELAVPLPYFAVVFGCWLVYYDAERALHRTASGRDRFWSRGGYFLHHLRQLVLFVGFPVGLVVVQQAVNRFAPETAREDWFLALGVAVVPLMLVFVPLLVKPLLGLKSMPPGPTRDRLEAVARRVGFRYADLLVWPTHGFSTNAMILGVVPRLRYVIFTDGILEELAPDEVDAVFGHEVGHARHGHLWFYGLFLVVSLAALAAVFVLTERALDAAARDTPEAWYVLLAAEHARWVLLVPLAAAGAYLFVVFGFLSRGCERQADVFGCRAVSCTDPHCTGHDDRTVYAAGGAGLCPTGIRTCARALERVYHLTGAGPDAGGRWTPASVARAVFGWLKAWQHGPMPRRVRFLLSLLDDRARERRFQRRLLALRWGLAVGLAAALVVLGEVVGWRELLKAL